MTKINKLVIFIILILGFLSSFTIFYMIDDFQEQNLYKNLNLDAENLKGAVGRSHEINTMILTSIKRFFESSEFISEEEFKNFNIPFITENQSLSAIFWITGTDKETMKSFGEIGKTPEDILRNRESAPVHSSMTVHPVFYSVERDGSHSFVGMDMASYPEVRDAIEYARVIGGLSISKAFSLDLENEENKSFIMLLPVSNGKGSFKVSGLVAGVININSFIENSFVYGNLTGLDISMSVNFPDGSSDQIYHNCFSSDYERISKSVSVSARSILLGDTFWRINITGMKEYISANKNNMRWFVLVLGTVLTLILTILYWVKVKEQDRIKYLVELRTNQLKLSEERLDFIIRGADLGAWDWDIRSNKITVNEKVLNILDYPVENIEEDLGFWISRIHGDDRAKVQNEISNLINNKIDSFNIDYRLQKSNGTWMWFEDAGKVFERDNNGKPLRATGTRIEITDKIEKEEKLQILSSTDPLTGLWNRRFLFERIEGLLNMFNRSGEVFSLALLDIDHFKNFNDDFGHLTGDFVLKELSTILKNGIRPYDLVGRYGGEEFLIIFNRTDKIKASIVLDRIRKIVFNKKFTRDGNTFSISFSGGICDTTELENKDQELEALIQLADSRMYLGKKQGRNRVIFES